MSISALLAGLLSGILGSMGLGGGAVLVIYLSLFQNIEQLKAQGINLIFFIPIALASVIIYSKNKKIKWKIVIKLVITGVIGTLIGWKLISVFKGDLTGKLFGVLLIIMGIFEIFSNKNKMVATKRNK